jgi:hypothetical protein
MSARLYVVDVVLCLWLPCRFTITLCFIVICTVPKGNVSDCWFNCIGVINWGTRTPCDVAMDNSQVVLVHHTVHEACGYGAGHVLGEGDAYDAYNDMSSIPIRSSAFISHFMLIRLPDVA